MDTFASARSMAAAVAAGDISAVELMDLHLARIAEVNPLVNAVVSLDEERARSGAAAADAVPADQRGALHGLPFATKDTHAAAGWRTTFGSPILKDNVPSSDDLVVERIRAAGAVLIGKTNVPEFAAGSHTFNPLFGTTRNPWDTSRSAGGSSGGAAAALAAGMVPLADGSDMGGSLRNPASFNGVVGMRPSLGRVPDWPSDNFWETVTVSGPLARTVDDLALLLSVIAGPDPRVPTALAEPGELFAPPVRGSLSGVRVALSVDLGGLFAVDDEVARIIEDVTGPLAAGGAQVSADHPDLGRADETFRVLRAWLFHHALGPLLAEHAAAMKPSLVANIRAGEGLSGEDVARAYAGRSALSEVMREFFTRYDVLALPVSQVPPFPADQEFPTAVNGEPMTDYLAWMRSAYVVSVTGCPAISVPAGLTAAGLPVGLQLVGPFGGERRLLEIAAGLESATGLRDLPAQRKPPV